MDNNSHEIARQIRQQFFVYRNGLLADNLRSSGDCHKMIFGLNLPQIVNIANTFCKDMHVATELWNSKDTRECRLIAPMLYPTELFDKNTAITWAEQTENYEIADNLCHKLLRNTSYASELCSYFSDKTEIEQYISLRLAINLLAIGKTIELNKMLTFATNAINSNNANIVSTAKRLIEDIQDLEQ